MRKKTLFYFYAIIVLMFAGAINKYLTVFAVLGSALTALIIAINSKKRADINICKGLILLLLTQNVCIGLGAHLFHNTDSSLQYLTQIPFVCTFVIWIISCKTNIEKLSSESLDSWFLILIVCIMLSTVLGFGGFASAAVSFRNMTTFFMAYSIGRNNAISQTEVSKLIRFFAKCGVIVTIVGVIILVGGYDFYKWIGIHEVYIAKAAAFSSGRLDGRFYTKLFSGRRLIRMGSVFYEPVNMGYFLSCCLLCCTYDKFWTKKSKRSISIAVIAIGLILTVGKGGYLITAASMACMFVDKLVMQRKQGSKAGFRRKTLIATMLIAGWGMMIAYMNRFGYAVWNHIWGIQRTLQNVVSKPIGHGLGSGGNAAQVFSNNAGDWLSTGGETALMSFFYQIGIQGGIALISCFIAMSNSQRIGTSGLSRLCIYLPYILVGVSIMQDNTYTPQCIVPFMLIQGAVNAVTRKDSSVFP